MIYATRTASILEEAITIVCEHELKEVTTDNGTGNRCSKCSLFQSDDWFSPVPVLAEPAIVYRQPEWLASWLK